MSVGIWAAAEETVSHNGTGHEDCGVVAFEVLSAKAARRGRDRPRVGDIFRGGHHLCGRLVEKDGAKCKR